MYQIFLYNLQIAVDAILQNKVRSILTSLGIIFGVSSVISMLAIGRGAQQEILDQMKLLGTNNIIVQPIVDQVEGDVSDVSSKVKSSRPYTPGLTMADMMNIEVTLPNVSGATAEVIYETTFIRDGKTRSGKMVGVNESYFDINKMDFYSGANFTTEHIDMMRPVCIIGYGVAAKFFPGENPIGKEIKCGPLWLTIVGVLQNRTQTIKNPEKLGIRDFNLDIFVPIQSMLIRYKDRALITAQDLQTSRSSNSGGRVIIMGGSSDDSDSEQTVYKNINQLDKIIIQVENSNAVSKTAEIIYRMLKRRHNDVIDFEITIPEQLLEQEQRTKNIFNIVLSAIASISLIVGGIGIMNIMLASVLERYKEIGVRMAIGARKRDIHLQFLAEALAISVSGGLIGIFLGFVFCEVIEKTTQIPTVISPLSIIISFFVALGVGLVFGIVPARKAAEYQPAEAVRYE